MSETISIKKVNIVTPVHNRRELTLQSLRSMKKLRSDGLEISITVVDDGSTDGTSEAVSENFPDVQLIRGDGNLWFAGAMNLGIDAALKAGADYIFTVNDDTVFDENCLVRAVECAEKHPRSVVGGLLLLWDQPHKVFQVAPRWETLLGGFRHWYHQTVWTIPNRPWEVDLIVGNCLLLPAEAVRECGMMNNAVFPHFGDVEYTPRLKRMGWRLLIEPKARVFCQPNTPPPSVRKMSFWKKVKTLFIDKINGNSVRKRFLTGWYGAPNKFAGMAALPIFYIRYFLGINIEGAYAKSLKEPMLKDIYADRVV